jgi:hypothetical protein
MGFSANDHLNEIEIMFYNVSVIKDVISSRASDFIRGDGS